MILIGISISSGCITKYVDTHVPLSLPNNCNFEKLTEEQRNYLGPNRIDNPIGDSIGRKIYRNQNTCNERQTRIDTLVKTHNEESEE